MTGQITGVVAYAGSWDSMGLPQWSMLARLA